MAIVHIGIGSNLGDRRNNCIEAVRRLNEFGVRVLKQSSLIETKPWGVVEQPCFINMAIEAESDLEPDMLLTLMKKIEQEMGRGAAPRWGPRIIDLDILFYDDLIIDSDYLRIPHPRLHERDFVLTPLTEIAPEKRHPVLQQTVLDLLSLRKTTD